MMLLNETFNIFFVKKIKDSTRGFIIVYISIILNNQNNRWDHYLICNISVIIPKIYNYEIYNVIIKIIT